MTTWTSNNPPIIYILYIIKDRHSQKYPIGHFIFYSSHCHIYTYEKGGASMKIWIFPLIYLNYVYEIYIISHPQQKNYLALAHINKRMHSRRCQHSCALRRTKRKLWCAENIYELRKSHTFHSAVRKKILT